MQAEEHDVLKLRIRELRTLLEERHGLESIRAGTGEFGAGAEELARQLECLKALDVGLSMVGARCSTAQHEEHARPLPCPAP